MYDKKEKYIPQSSQRDLCARAGRHVGKSICLRDPSRRHAGVFYCITSSGQKSDSSSVKFVIKYVSNL